MGVDLTIIVSCFGFNDEMPLAYERMRLDRSYGLFDSLKDKAGLVPLGEGRKLLWYSDDGIEHTTTDAYGEPIKSTRAKLMADVMMDHDILSCKNTAVAAYLSVLPPDTEIFLWWH